MALARSNDQRPAASEAVVVIPAFKEATYLPMLIESLLQTELEPTIGGSGFGSERCRWHPAGVRPCANPVGRHLVRLQDAPRTVGR